MPTPLDEESRLLFPGIHQYLQDEYTSPVKAKKLIADSSYSKIPKSPPAGKRLDPLPVKMGPTPIKRSGTIMVSGEEAHHKLANRVAQRLHVKSDLEHLASLDISNTAENTAGAKRLNGIICTIGPASSSVEMLVKLMEAGMNIARLNFSHGSYEQHAGLIANVREAASRAGRLVGLALDTKGPEIRTGKIREDLGKEIIYEAGSRVKVTTNRMYYTKCAPDLMFVDYVNLPKVVFMGGKIFVDDGLLQMDIYEIGDDYVMCTCLNSAPISDHKGVNLPDAKVDLPAISEKDKADLRFAREQNLDMIFASFIRKASDIRDVREALGPGEKILVVAKIENQEGCDNFLDVLKETDGVMVARGDLGIEIPPEKVFICQKAMIANCNILGKPVICATQMLESMTKNPRPTRAEVSDVANAIIDGADCVMLSGETAKGKYPLNAVQIMAKTCLEAQCAILPRARFEQVRLTQPHPLSAKDVVAQSAVNTAYEVGAAAIVVLSNTGTSGRSIAKYRPHCPIFAVTSKPTNARQLLLSRAVFPVLTEEPADRRDYDSRIMAGIRFGKESGELFSGDLVVAVHSDGKRPELGANMVRIITVP